MDSDRGQSAVVVSPASAGPTTDAPTLQRLLSEHVASLNAVRLTLALLVLYDHAHPLGGFGSDPAWPATRGVATTFGGFAVGAFFALSGLLVTMSGMRRSPYEYLRSRCLRIVPAYVFVLVAVATILGPIIWIADHGGLHGYFNFRKSGPIVYVVRNVFFPTQMQFAINDVFKTTTPYGTHAHVSALNGSLWTLPLEVRCYVVALVVVIVGRALGTTRVSVGALAVVAGVILLRQTDPALADAITPAWLAGPMGELLFVFLCGSVIGTVAGTLRVSKPLVLGAVAVYTACSFAGAVWFRTVGLGSLAVLLPVLASLLPTRRMQVFRNDLSYGTYVWAFPAQQTIAYLKWDLNKFSFVLITGTVTIGLALISWFLVEKPALSARGKPSRPTAAGASCATG